MKRFAFKLEKVLEVREYWEHLSEMKLAEKAGRCAILQNELEENARRTHKAALERFASGRTILDFITAELFMKRLEQDKERKLRELAAAELEREKARADYLEKHRDKEIIEKLKERKRDEYYKEAQRLDIKTIDDVAQSARRLNNPFSAAYDANAALRQE